MMLPLRTVPWLLACALMLLFRDPQLAAATDCNGSAPIFSNVTSLLDSNQTSLPDVLNNNGGPLGECNTTVAPQTPPFLNTGRVGAVVLTPAQEIARVLYRVVCVMAVVSFAAGRGTPMTILLDAQLLGLLSLSGCVSAEHQLVLEAGVFLAVPGALGHDAVSIMQGVAICVAGGLAICVAVWCVAVVATGARSPIDVPALEFGCVPGGFLALSVFTLSGMCFSASTTLIAASGGDTDNLVPGVIFAAAAGATLVVFTHCNLRAMREGRFRTHSFIRRWGELPPAADNDTNMAMSFFPEARKWRKILGRRLPPWVVDAIMPVGEWAPRGFVLRYGPCVDAIVKGHQPYVAQFNLVRAMCLAAAAAIPTASGAQCVAKHGIIATCNAVFGVCVFVFWVSPRVAQRQPIIAASGIGSAFAAIGMSHPVVYHLVPTAVLFLSGLWVLAALADAAQLWFEWSVLAPTEEAIRESHRATLKQRNRLKPRPPRPAPASPPPSPPPESVDPDDLSDSNASTVDFLETRRQGPLQGHHFRDALANPLPPRPLAPQYHQPRIGGPEEVPAVLGNPASRGRLDAVIAAAKRRRAIADARASSPEEEMAVRAPPRRHGQIMVEDLWTL